MSKLPTVKVFKEGMGNIIINQSDYGAYKKRGFTLAEGETEPKTETAEAPKPVLAEGSTVTFTDGDTELEGEVGAIDHEAGIVTVVAEDEEYELDIAEVTLKG